VTGAGSPAAGADSPAADAGSAAAGADSPAADAGSAAAGAGSAAAGAGSPAAAAPPELSVGGVVSAVTAEHNIVKAPAAEHHPKRVNTAARRCANAHPATPARITRNG
jgi:hypothetical protein